MRQKQGNCRRELTQMMIGKIQLSTLRVEVVHTGNHSNSVNCSNDQDQSPIIVNVQMPTSANLYLANSECCRLSALQMAAFESHS